MYHTFICAIVVIVLTSTVVVAKPHDTQDKWSERRAVLPPTRRPGKRRGRGWQNRHHAIADHAVG